MHNTVIDLYPETPVITITLKTINAFKSTWPCHAIPDDADLVVCLFDTARGKRNLVDYDVSRADDSVIDPATMPDAGPALSAMMDDALTRHQGSN